LSDLAARVAGLLEEHRHKPRRVQARLVAELVETDQERHLDTDAPPDTITDKSRPDPKAWVQFRKRLNDDPFGALVDAGVATTRNRTHAALHALGLDPTEVRAVVIEHDSLRVYRYDTHNQASVPQTVPILEDRTA
jgi:hypothetical protein